MNSKSWYQSKMVWLGVLQVIGGIAEFIAGLPPGVSTTTVITGIATIIIRFMTNQPVGR